MLSEGLQIALPDFEVGNAMLKGDYLRQVVEIVIGGVPSGIKIHLMCVYMSLGRILLQGSVVTNLFSPVRYQVHLWKVEVHI
jgi:hypothetical protein